MSKRSDELAEELNDLEHAMQDGVAMKMDHNPRETQPKQLRGGVNAAMIAHSAVASLLVEKGIFTMEEYSEALVVATFKEVARYEQELSDLTGTKITLR